MDATRGPDRRSDRALEVARLRALYARANAHCAGLSAIAAALSVAGLGLALLAGMGDRVLIGAVLFIFASLYFMAKIRAAGRRAVALQYKVLEASYELDQLSTGSGLASNPGKDGLAPGEGGATASHVDIVVAVGVANAISAIMLVWSLVERGTVSWF